MKYHIYTLNGTMLSYVEGVFEIFDGFITIRKDGKVQFAAHSESVIIIYK